MQFAAAFVEYLVTGVVALAWAVPLMSRIVAVPALDETTVLLAIPLLFVLGMYVDAAASLLLKTTKRLLKKEKVSRGNRFASTVTVLRGSPELAQELRAMVLRDRVARGVCLNALLATGAALTSASPHPFTLGAVAAAITVVSFPMWWRFDNLSSEFTAEAVKQITAKDR